MGVMLFHGVVRHDGDGTVRVQLVELMQQRIGDELVAEECHAANENDDTGHIVVDGRCTGLEAVANAIIPPGHAACCVDPYPSWP